MSHGTSSISQYLDPLASGEARLSAYSYSIAGKYLDPLASGEARLALKMLFNEGFKFRSTSLRRG